MIPRMNIIGRKVSVVSVSGAGGFSGCSEMAVGLLRKFSGSKEYLNWLKIDLNATEIITVEDYKHAQS